MKRFTFNRTTEELKLVRYWALVLLSAAFNRTTEELKLFKVAAMQGLKAAFNRTTEELKQMTGMGIATIKRLLIEPLRN